MRPILRDPYNTIEGWGGTRSEGHGGIHGGGGSAAINTIHPGGGGGGLLPSSNKELN